MAVEEGGGDTELPYDGGHVGVLVPACDELPGRDGEDAVMQPLPLLGGQVHYGLVGLVETGLQLGLYLGQRLSLCFEFRDPAKDRHMLVGVEGAAGGGLLGPGEQTLAQIEVDGGPGDPGHRFQIADAVCAHHHVCTVSSQNENAPGRGASRGVSSQSLHLVSEVVD